MIRPTKNKLLRLQEKLVTEIDGRIRDLSLSIMSTNSQKAVDAVSAARALAGISQKQLAALTGIDQSDISKIERGVANPSIATLDRIATALGGHLSITIDMPTSAG